MIYDTVCAISTALKQGAISIVRMSGADSFEIIREVAHLERDKIKPNTIIYGHIYDDDQMLDEVLISFFKAPKSYTGEDMVEINCHGSIYVTRTILNLLLKKGCRLAEPGEFTKRAYLNERISLSKADSINDLIKADNAISAKNALRGLNGSVERLLNPIYQEMKDVLAMIEVNIDYPEYEDERQMSNDVIKPYLRKWINQCEEMVEKAERFRIVKDGIKTVIIGKPNVGKSSLLNALIEEDKAIVTDVAGTTRDLVEGRVKLKNITLDLIDTAGIRNSADKIERIGIEKSLKALQEAELVLLVLDASNLSDEDEELLELTRNHKRLVIYNKSDLKKQDGLSISAKNNEISALVDRINEMYQDDILLADEDILNNERQIALMKSALEHLRSMYLNIDELFVDVIAVDLQEAFHDLCQINGIEYQEDLIDHMFRNFCLGK